MIKFLRFYLLILLVIISLISLIWLVLWKTQDMRFYNVQTNSMAPVLKPGDLAVSVKIRPESLQIGDIVTYSTSQNPFKTITHRVYQTHLENGYIVTKGDNLTQPDPPVAYSDLKSKTIKAIPNAGYFFSFVHRPAGLISVIYIPALFISALELNLLLSHFSYRSYKQDNASSG